MFLFQFLFNFIVYSGSVQAATTMPLMVPLADLIGLTRQSAVMAFQLGDGLSSLLWPPAGPLMAGLSLAEIPYLKWLRWIAPLLGIFIALAVAILAVADETLAARLDAFRADTAAAIAKKDAAIAAEAAAL